MHGCVRGGVLRRKRWPKRQHVLGAVCSGVHLPAWLCQRDAVGLSSWAVQHVGFIPVRAVPCRQVCAMVVSAPLSHGCTRAALGCHLTAVMALGFAGQYGSSTALPTASCSGPCAGGTYGSASGLTQSTCTSVCSAGYACPPGSTSPYQLTCPPGQYSLSSAASCTNCPVGTYGSNSALTSPSCTGPCAAGYYGSSTGQNSSTCSGQCPTGHFCPAGTSNPTANPCAKGQYSDALGAVTCTPCPGGRYGSTTGLTTSQCSGNCRYCLIIMCR